MRVDKLLKCSIASLTLSLFSLCSAVYAALPVPEITGVALSTTSIQWNWTDESAALVDGYHLYSTTAPTFIIINATYYIETGLRPNQQVDRYVTTYLGPQESNASEDDAVYSYAFPPDGFTTVSTVTVSSAYIEFRFSSATSYALEISTDNGNTYNFFRQIFVPWQTLAPLECNKQYMIRLGAVNGDDEQTPGIYSSTSVFITPPPDPVFFATAVSSCSLCWQWTSTSAFAAAGVTGYNLYHSTTTIDGTIPNDGLDGQLVGSVPDVSISSYTMVFTDSVTFISANSPHTFWLRAAGLIESVGKKAVTRFTYATAPSTCTLTEYDFLHVFETGMDLSFAENGHASSYIVEYSTTGGFSSAVNKKPAGGPSSSLSQLTNDTKYDIRIGAVNGDNIQTPLNAENPMAYSATYKVATRLPVPDNLHASPVTDTIIDWSWSTGTYTNTASATGYTIYISSFWVQINQTVLLPVAHIAGKENSSYQFGAGPEGPLMTNSVHTRYVGATQFYAGYACYGSLAPATTGCTFATPPNDVFFDTVTARTISLWWKEPEIPATMYRIERSTVIAESGPWLFVSSVTGTRFIDTGLQPMTTYAYRLGAYNQLGQLTNGLAAATNNNRRDYSFVSGTETIHVGPQFYGVAVGTSSICWNWVEVVPGVLRYNILSSTNTMLNPGLSVPATSWIETGLNGADTGFSRRIQSQTAFGWGDYTDATCYTLANAPSNPATSSVGTHSLTLSWNANGSTRFLVQRSTDNATWAMILAPTVLTIVPTLNDIHLHYLTTYYYMIYAYNQNSIMSPASVLTQTITTDVPSYATIVKPGYSNAIDLTASLTGFGQVRVTIPAGAAPVDGYIFANTAAGTNPTDTTTGNISIATNKLKPSILLESSIMELHYYDAYGSTVTQTFNSPVRLYMPYPDVNGDDLVDNVLTKMHAHTLRIYTMDTLNITWSLMPTSVVDVASTRVYADLNHFSMYALGSLIAMNSSVKDALAFPNPYKPGSGTQFDSSALGEGIVFQGLTPRAHIRIFSIAGDLVADSLIESDDGRYLWDIRNTQGDKVASGLYIYLINNADDPSDKLSGKLAVIK